LAFLHSAETRDRRIDVRQVVAREGELFEEAVRGSHVKLRDA